MNFSRITPPGACPGNLRLLLQGLGGVVIVLPGKSIDGA